MGAVQIRDWFPERVESVLIIHDMSMISMHGCPVQTLGSVHSFGAVGDCVF